MIYKLVDKEGAFALFQVSQKFSRDNIIDIIRDIKTMYPEENAAQTAAKVVGRLNNKDRDNLYVARLLGDALEEIDLLELPDKRWHVEFEKIVRIPACRIMEGNHDYVVNKACNMADEIDYDEEKAETAYRMVSINLLEPE